MSCVPGLRPLFREDLRTVLERGVQALRTASEVTGLSDPRHLAFNLPRLADCLRSLGRLEEAGAALVPCSIGDGRSNRKSYGTPIA